MGEFSEKGSGPFGFSDETRRALSGAAAGLSQQGQRMATAAWASMLPPEVGAALMKGSEEQGAQAAQQIRERYYKKEFDKIREVRINPIQEALQQKNAQLTAAGNLAVRPIGRIVNYEEGQVRADAAAADGNKGLGQIRKGPDGKSISTPPPGPAENPAAGQGPLGTMEYTDTLSIIDPATGEPVEALSERGMAIASQLESESWQNIQTAATQVLDIYAEYSGNPFADRAAQQMIQNTMNTAGRSATGKDGNESQTEHMLGLQQQQADLEATRSETGVQVMAVEQTQAKIDAQVAKARAFAGDPELVGDMDPKLVAKLRSGKPLTERQEKEAAASASMIQDRIDKEQVRRKAAGMNTIPMPMQSVEHTPNWQSHMMTSDPAMQRYVENSIADDTQKLVQDFRSVEHDETKLDNMLAKYNADDHVKTMIKTGQWNDPYVQSWMTMAATTPETRQKAVDGGYLKRLVEVDRNQPGVRQVIDDEIGRYIRQLGETHEISADKEAEMRADRYVTFFQASQGRDPANQYRDIGTIQNLESVRDTIKARKALQSRIQQGIEAETAQEGGRSILSRGILAEEKTRADEQAYQEYLAAEKEAGAPARRRMSILSPERVSPDLTIGSPQSASGLGESVGEVAGELTRPLTLEEAFAWTRPGGAIGGETELIRGVEKAGRIAIKTIGDVASTAIAFGGGLGKGFTRARDEEEEE